jgi:ketosteroid isomerase-like protein
MTALRKTVDEFNAATKDAMLSGNSDKVMTYYEDTALEMAPNMALVTGKAAIKEFQDKMFHSGMKITAAAFKTLELEAGGKIAYEVGTYEMSITMPQGGEMKDQGKYIAIWRHQTNGSWKVHAETWNSNMPLPPMEPQEGKKDETKGKK